MTYEHSVNAFDVEPGVRRIDISFYTRIKDGSRLQLFTKWALEALVKVDRIVSTMQRTDVIDKLQGVAQVNGTEHREVTK